MGVGVPNALTTSQNSMDVFKTFRLMTITRRHLMLLAVFAQMLTVG